MGKIEKLKEVNEIIKNICVNLETRIFVENMDAVYKRIIKKCESKDVERK